MINISRTFLLSMFGTVLSLTAADYDGYWRQTTPSRTQSLACKVVRDEDEMRKALELVKWDTTSAPGVDWSRSAAVIIAPERYYRGYALSFLALNGSEIQWGFRRPTARTRNTTSESIGAGKDGL